LNFALSAVIFIAVRNGGLKVTGEMGMNNTGVLFYAYLMCTIYFAAKNAGKLNYIGWKQAGVLLRWGMLSGFCSFWGMQLYSSALALGPASIVAPIFSLYNLVIVLGAIIFFKERLNRLQTAAIIFSFIGIVLVR